MWCLLSGKISSRHKKARDIISNSKCNLFSTFFNSEHFVFMLFMNSPLELKISWSSEDLLQHVFLLELLLDMFWTSRRLYRSQLASHVCDDEGCEDWLALNSSQKLLISSAEKATSKPQLHKLIRRVFIVTLSSRLLLSLCIINSQFRCFLFHLSHSFRQSFTWMSKNIQNAKKTKETDNSRCNQEISSPTKY